MVARMPSRLNPFAAQSRLEQDPGHGVVVVGGKGATSRKTPAEIDGSALEQLQRAYEYQPDDYEELVELEGIGPGSLRALALIAELVSDTESSREDPAKYAYAHGGKDGTPHPVERERYDESIDHLRSMLDGAELERETKQESLKRLAKLE